MEMSKERLLPGVTWDYVAHDKHNLDDNAEGELVDNPLWWQQLVKGGREIDPQVG